MPAFTRYVLVLGDSLAYHGPQAAVPLTDERLYPNVMAAALGHEVRVDVLAQLGWTAREAWWALTKDPHSWGEYVGRADGLLLAVGGFDQLPAAVPTYVRESLAYVRPGSLRRRAKTTYSSLAPHVMRATDGRMRQLPQRATDVYLTRCLEGVRAFRPDIPTVLMGPSPYDSAMYPSQRPHAPAVAAARSWAQGADVGFVDIDPLVTPCLGEGRNNPDGLHWGWQAHSNVGQALSAAFIAAGWNSPDEALG